MGYRIPFNKPPVAGSEVEYIREAIAAGRTSGDGPFTRRCQQLLETRFGAARALLTTSCTAALEMAGLLCDLKAGDEVIMPSYTFVSTANAIVLRGAVPVFVDVRPDTLNLDERLIEGALTPRTRAVWPVHYAGVACEMDEIMAIARRHGLTVVEDAAQGVFASYRGRWLGTIGDLGCYSFHETKNFTCGEGGALLVNAERFLHRAEILREKGTNRSQFLRGQVDKYTWVDVGSSYVPSDLLAAFLYAQLEHMEAITAKRRAVFERYMRELSPLAERGLVRLPVVPAQCSTNYHMFYLLTAGIEERTALIEHLKRAGIQSVFHYVPLHTSPVGRSLGGREGMLPVTEDASARLLRLPLYCDMTATEVGEVIVEIYRFFGLSAPT
ncbi:MAG TPA: dTDP-4-amino-4,6-dideoxygalactose transaminase [Steroidobacteraceae bacterium]|nr:dTDP-4-amino-4,6-dideoxygalactose transaminase [Steroidobacteraceae bacterium]